MNKITSQEKPLLKVEQLKLEFNYSGRSAYPVKNVSFELDEGKTMALVGESGSGKTLTALSVIGLLPEKIRQIGGIVWFNGRPLEYSKRSADKSVRGSEISFIFQDPVSALNPVFRVGNQLKDVVKQHLKMSGRDARNHIFPILEQVGFSEPGNIWRSYPHQLSGGMAQRVMIAMALSTNPRLIIADEPTSALDITTQNRLLHLLFSLQRSVKFSLLIITHDISLAANFCDDMAVMHNGEIVESGPVSVLIKNPAHSQTRILIKDGLDRDDAHLSLNMVG